MPSVPITFPTNTVDLTKAIDLLKNSKTATDQLRDSAKKLGTDTATSGRQFASTLEGMNLRLAQLKGQISLTSQSNTTALNKLSAEYKALQAEIDKTNRKLFEQEQHTKSLVGTWQSMAVTFRAVIAALAIREIVNLGLEMTKLAGQVEGVKRAFDKLPNSTLLLEQLKKATHGTVTELELMQNAIKFQNFKLPLTDLGKYLEFAAIRAQQTGESVDYMVNSIVTGLGRGSIKILDNLQINVNALKQDMKETGATIQEAFGRQVQLEMEKLGGYLETGATQAQKLDTNFKNLYATLSKKFEQSAFVKSLSTFIEEVNNGLLTEEELLDKKAGKDSDRAIQRIEENNKQIKNEKEKTKAIIEDIDAEIKRRQESIYTLNIEAGTRQAALDIAKKTSGAANAKDIRDEQSRIEQMKERAKILEASTTILREYTSVLNDNLNKRKDVSLSEEEQDKLDEERKLFNELLIEQTKERGAAEADAAIKTAKSLDDLAESYRKAYGIVVDSFKLLRSDAVIPTLHGIEEDTEETTEFAMEAWQEFFARFRIGWSESGKHFKSIQDEMNDVVKEIKETAFDVTESLILAEINSEVDGYNQRIANAQNYYDKLIDLAGNNEQRKVQLQIKRDNELKKLEKQKDEAETRAAKRKVYLESAIAVARAFADYQYPYSLIVAGLVAVSALAQVNEINKAPKGYAKGVIALKGPGSETSDSIPAMLSKNESVMTAQETRDSYKTLHKIRAGKLNDKVLDKILAGNVTVVGSDDRHTAEKLDELIKITKANRPPDYVEKAGILYRVQTKGSNSKRYIRSKYGNFN